MNLIKNKKSSEFSSALTLNQKKHDHNLKLKDKIASVNTKAITERHNPIHTNQKCDQDQEKQGLIARALSNTKTLIKNFISPLKDTQQEKQHVVGEKYIYKEIDMIGKGYSSQVYKGALLSNPQNKTFAVKVLDLSKTKGFLFELLKKQIEIHKNLEHQNIVQCFDVVQTKTCIYIILQYCSGGDLSTYIRKKKITEKQALSIMSQIVDGYKHLLKEKVLHRDLKPCNIFKCGKKKAWKIGDFGFSCKTTQQPGDINVGTPIYMPPESLEKSLYSHKSDFFALGVIMYQMLFGKVPWFSKSQSLLITKMKELKINFQQLKPLIYNPLITKFINKCCQVSMQKRLDEEQFLKLQLFPRENMKIDEQKILQLKTTSSIALLQFFLIDQYLSKFVDLILFFRVQDQILYKNIDDHFYMIMLKFRPVAYCCRVTGFCGFRGLNVRFV